MPGTLPKAKMVPEQLPVPALNLVSLGDLGGGAGCFRALINFSSPGTVVSTAGRLRQAN
jgi:hypothetical protein